MYSARGSLFCNIPNVVYIISGKNRRKQYAGPFTDFKAKYKIHKSDIKTKKDNCVTYVFSTFNKVLII